MRWLFRMHGISRIATDGGGLYLYDWQKHQVKTILSRSLCLPTPSMPWSRRPIGKVWMSTDKGLAFISHGKVTNLNFVQGIGAGVQAYGCGPNPRRANDFRKQ